MVYGADAAFVGGYTETLAQFPSADLEEIAAKVDAAVVEYRKDSGNVTVVLPLGSSAWALDGQALTARVDGAALDVHARLRGADRGFATYAVCAPPASGGWIESSTSYVDVRFAG